MNPQDSASCVCGVGGGAVGSRLRIHGFPTVNKCSIAVIGGSSVLGAVSSGVVSGRVTCRVVASLRLSYRGCISTNSATKVPCVKGVGRQLATTVTERGGRTLGSTERILSGRRCVTFGRTLFTSRDGHCGCGGICGLRVTHVIDRGEERC